MDEHRYSYPLLMPPLERLVEEVHGTDDVVVLVQRGTPVAVLVDARWYETMKSLAGL